MKYTGEVAESWPFDYELSYIRFAYSDLTVSGDMVSVTVNNIGQYVGKEIVRLYVEAPQDGLQTDSGIEGLPEVDSTAG